MPWAKHERVQLIAAITIQTALVGSLASVGISGKGQAIATVILVGTVNVLPSPLSFGMVSYSFPCRTYVNVLIWYLGFSPLGKPVRYRSGCRFDEHVPVDRRCYRHCCVYLNPVVSFCCRFPRKCRGCGRSNWIQRKHDNASSCSRK